MTQLSPAQPAAPAAPGTPAAPAGAPPAPAPVPGTPSVDIGTGDGPIPLGGLPRSAAEVDGLRARRDILRDQLERATNRRSQLVRQLDDRGPQSLPDEARVGVQQRLTLLDERILQIEREQGHTERLLSNAPAELLSQTMHGPPAHRGPTMGEDEAAALAIGTFGLGIAFTMVAGWFRRRRAARRGRAPASAPAASLAEDPRFERLAQTVDAMAEEMERIGEGQRFVTQLLASQRQSPALHAEAERR